LYYREEKKANKVSKYLFKQKYADFLRYLSLPVYSIDKKKNSKDDKKHFAPTFNSFSMDSQDLKEFIFENKIINSYLETEDNKFEDIIFFNYDYEGSEKYETKFGYFLNNFFLEEKEDTDQNDKSKEKISAKNI